MCVNGRKKNVMLPILSIKANGNPGKNKINAELHRETNCVIYLEEMKYNLTGALGVRAILAKMHP